MCQNEGGLLDCERNVPMKRENLDKFMIETIPENQLNYYFNVKVSHVCQEAACRVAFCIDCMKDYIQYSAGVQHTNEEAYRIWYNKNKSRKMSSKKSETRVSSAIASVINPSEKNALGMTHEKWLMNKELLAKRHSTTGISSILRDDYAFGDASPKKSKMYVHNITFDQWSSTKAKNIVLKK